MNHEKNNILLIAAKHSEALEYGVGNSLSLGLLLVGSILKKANYNVSVLDASLDVNFEDKLQDAIKHNNYLFIGFSVMTTQYNDSLQLSKLFKNANPSVPIVFGGFHPTIAAKEILFSNVVDYAFMGQAYSNILDFVNYLNKLTSIETVHGLCYKKDNSIHYTKKYCFSLGDDFPEIDFDILETAILERVIANGDPMLQGRRTLGILTGFGCKFKCAFCWNSIYKNPIFRMNPKRIVEYCVYLKEKFNIELFWLYDEHFFEDIDYFESFYQENMKLQLVTQYYVSARSSDINKMKRYQTLKKCQQIGIAHLGVGAESGSQRVLNYIKKGITTSQTLMLAQECAKYNITCFFSFIIGIPTETSKESIYTFQLIQKIIAVDSRHQVIGPQVFRPYPGSVLSQTIYSEHIGEIDTQSFRKFRINNIFWIKENDAIAMEKQYATYNIQSQQANFEGLMSILVWSPFGILMQKIVGKATCNAFMHIFLLALRYSASLRIKFAFFKFYPEYKLVKFLDEQYFIH